MMQEFHSKHYTAEKSVLVGLDIDHATLVALGEKLDLSKGGAGSLPSKYYGGEARQSGGGSHTCIAVIMYFYVFHTHYTAWKLALKITVLFSQNFDFREIILLLKEKLNVIKTLYTSW